MKRLGRYCWERWLGKQVCIHKSILANNHPKKPLSCLTSDGKTCIPPPGVLFIDYGIFLAKENTNSKSSKSQPRLEIFSQHPSITQHFVLIRLQAWKVHTRLRQCPPNTDFPSDLQWIAPKLIVGAGKHCSIPQRHTRKTNLRMAAPTFFTIFSSPFSKREQQQHTLPDWKPRNEKGPLKEPCDTPQQFQIKEQ